MLQALTFTNPSKLMSDVAISVENISKCYRIGTQGGPAYHRLSEMITGVPQALWNAGKSLVRKSSIAAGAVPDVQNTGEFWALKDVSFEIKQGEVVGIIGRNGAGKSTLLKILSRITEPTSGRFGVRGRVASLLEVGTGFHPELTGRENIYVSGVTLGMARTEIKERFDEIVEFSGVEKFLDTPVKHYSSGMQVRLGFAVAAHLQSEVLIVDEVLAVGDAEFQKKCIGKMGAAAADGRTVLFVSHQFGPVVGMCSLAILLNRGSILSIGAPPEIVQAYTASLGNASANVLMPTPHEAQLEIHLTEVTCFNSQGIATNSIGHDEYFDIRATYQVNECVPNASIRVIFSDEFSKPVFISDIALEYDKISPHSQVNVTARTPAYFLRPRKFLVGLYVFIPKVLIIESIHHAMEVTISDQGLLDTINEPLDYGCVFGPCQWTIGTST